MKGKESKLRFIYFFLFLFVKVRCTLGFLYSILQTELYFPGG